MEHHQHRSGSLKQSNKGFKGGKHDSKGAVKRRAQGKVETNQPRQSLKNLAIAPSKFEIQKQKQKHLAQSKKNEILERRRLGLPDLLPPRIVSIVSLDENCDTSKIKTLLLQKLVNNGTVDESSMETTTGQENTVFSTVSITSKVRMMLMECRSNDVEIIVEYCKLSDIVLFVVDANQPVLSERAERIFSIVKAQSVPTVMQLIQNFSEIPLKKKNDLKKQFVSSFHFHFPDEPKVLPIDTEEDASQVNRYLENIHINQIVWRNQRAYMIIEKAQVVPQSDIVTIEGFVRAQNLSAKQIIHIPDFGDYQIEKIELVADPHIRRKSFYTGEMDDTQAPTIIDQAEKQDRDTIQTYNTPDPLDLEQPIITNEEIEMAKNKKKKLVPKGTSSYQSSWYLDDDEQEDQDDVDDQEMDNMMDDEQVEHEQQQMGQDEEEEEEEEEGVEEEKEEVEEAKTEDNKWKYIRDKSQITDELLKESDDEGNDMQSESEDEETRRKDERTEIEFPDEVDCPHNVPARIRFSRYRGLKSFRSSPWNPKENLPLDYAKIYQFHSFNQSMKNSIALLERAPVKPGVYVRIHLVKGPKQLVDAINVKPHVAVGLYRYENKISVLHFNVEKYKTYQDTVKSKETVFFQYGWRKFSTNPIYSLSSPNCDKQKFEKYLFPGRNTVATIYGPISYPPTPLLIFKNSSCDDLIATGYLSSINPDRIICKRITLTGFIAKSISKKFVTVTDMFYYPEDIMWFKKVELYTKLGRTGHIKDSLGTHGRMKCLFDGTMNQQDTICMNLYKRVYPKWIDENSNLLVSEEQAKLIN
ncbi:hypothetical protein CYY_002227 [Polysphondylium violaceum]|uniref:Bms1-type G domain-containing protein n=1 Tax=Polysphondylium violaceum TaxID=133409 RepID=A0A8J4V747_9MYCE|nr:hypothetical protein CYY_002227 [Polysphondylium violaceum]